MAFSYLNSGPFGGFFVKLRPPPLLRLCVGAHHAEIGLAGWSGRDRTARWALRSHGTAMKTKKNFRFVARPNRALFVKHASGATWGYKRNSCHTHLPINVYTSESFGLSFGEAAFFFIPSLRARSTFPVRGTRSLVTAI